MNYRNIGPHLADDLLERYVMHRLPEMEVESVEEHLLACPACQNQTVETENYVFAAKAALREVARKPAARAFWVRSSSLLHSWLTVPLCAAAVAALALAIAVPLRRGDAGRSVSEVHLVAMRGAAAATQARAGSGLILNLDAGDLAPDGVRIVNSAGQEVWKGTPRRSAHEVRAVVAGRLEPGQYWVRLTRGGELLREYGLKIVP